MSTPVGQSDAQPLQARQRSSASPTAGSASPPTSEPSSASCSTRDRPRVESFSSRVARYDGHITPFVFGATHLPTPVQRCTALPKTPSSWTSFSPALIACRGRVGRRSASSGAGSTMLPGLSRLPGSQIALTAPKSAIDSSSYMIDSSSDRARPSPCSPDSEPPCSRSLCAHAVRKSRKTATPLT